MSVYQDILNQLTAQRLAELYSVRVGNEVYLTFRYYSLYAVTAPYT